MNNTAIKSNQVYIKATKSLVVLAFAFQFMVGSTVYASEINFENVSNMINQERANSGLPKLKINSELNNAASLKSKDMINRHYFEHFAFNLTPWDFVHMAGYDYLYAGENLAMDFSTTEGMVSAWMNSETHRDNILNPDYNEMGLGIVKGEYIQNNQPRETYMVTNMFGRKKPAIVKAFDFVAKNIFSIF